MNKLKIWFLNYFMNKELCPDCGIKMTARGYNHLVCPKCKQLCFCENGNNAGWGLDNE